MTILLKRVYEPPEPHDGARYLVDRLWPRGIAKGALALTGWLKELAPSHELRRWFGHDPARWEAFRQRYWRELLQNPRLEEIVRQLAQHRRVTLLYAASDALHNQAVVLREFLLSRMGNRFPAGSLALRTDSDCGLRFPHRPVRSKPARPQGTRRRRARQSRAPRGSVP